MKAVLIQHGVRDVEYPYTETDVPMSDENFKRVKEREPRQAELEMEQVEAQGGAIGTCSQEQVVDVVQTVQVDEPDAPHVEEEPRMARDRPMREIRRPARYTKDWVHKKSHIESDCWRNLKDQEQGSKDNRTKTGTANCVEVNSCRYET